MHIELPQKWLPQKLRFNQLQFGPTHTGIIDAGINVSLYNDRAGTGWGHIKYCRLKGITIQAWSPLQFGFFKGCSWYPTAGSTESWSGLAKNRSDSAVAIVDFALSRRCG